MGKAKEKKKLKSENRTFSNSIKLVLEHVASFLPRVQDNTTGRHISMANEALGRRDLFYELVTNSGTKLIFRIIAK